MIINELLKDCSLNSYLYNINLTLSEQQLEQFHGITYVCMQGSPERAKDFARKLAHTLLGLNMTNFEPKNMLKDSAFHCYRVGNILSISHGMGTASMLTLLHNISKVMYFAGNYDIEYLRIGTSGGIGVEAGSVILTDTAYMPNLVPGYKVSALGRDIIYPTGMSVALNNKILAAQPTNLDFKVLSGNSIAADDFYLGQARFDGVLKPRYDVETRRQYFSQIRQLNILNFEMESTALASFCNRAQIPATMIATTLLNRMESDQVTATPETLAIYSNRSHSIALNYLQAELSK